MNDMPPHLKFVAVAIIWVMVGLITLAQLVIVDGGNFNWIFSIAMFGIAGGVTSSILSDSDQSTKRPMIEVNTRTESDQHTGKRKNDQTGGLSAEMLALLDEDDIAELRHRVKMRLIERIEGGGDGELSSLDALLAEQDDTPRKSRR
jgi:hypothetical protein